MAVVQGRTLKCKVIGQSTSTTNQSAAAAADPTQQVSSLKNPYPTTGGTAAATLYPVPSANETANSLQVTRFVNLDQILVKARSQEEIPAAMKQITATLREQHKLGPGQDTEFH